MSTEDRYTVLIGRESVTVKVKGEGALRVATILGRKQLPCGRERIWLDRLVHPGGPMTVPSGIELSGAVSTIVTAPAGA